MKFKKMAILSILLSICIFFTSCNSSIDSPSGSGGNSGSSGNSGSNSSSGGQTSTSSSGGGDTVGTRDSTPVVLVPSADGTNVIDGNVSTIDISNISKGYVMIKYNGTNPKVKVQINYGSEGPYYYDMNLDGEYQAFPLSRGDGSYTIKIQENIQGTSYAEADAHAISVTMENEFYPFLYANTYVNFNENTEAIQLASELAKSANNDLDVINAVFDYVVNNISYDSVLAADAGTIKASDIDQTLQTKKGICWDYAALMTTMLRTQNIPTQLVRGMAGEISHAWLNVYTPETGWIYEIIYFDGTNWVRMDPTFTSSNNGSPEILQYIGDGTNYNPLNYY